MKINISVIIPMNNEADNIERIVKEVPQALNKISDIQEYEIICVDDASTDKTLEKLKCISDSKFKIISLEERGKKSTAILAGIRVAQYQYIGMIDADLQTDPNDFRY